MYMQEVLCMHHQYMYKSMHVSGQRAMFEVVSMPGELIEAVYHKKGFVELLRGGTCCCVAADMKGLADGTEFGAQPLPKA